MTDLLLGISLLTGCVQIVDEVTESAVVAACVAKLLTRQAWDDEVRHLVKRASRGDAVRDAETVKLLTSGDMFNKTWDSIRTEFNWWDWDEMVWLASDGQTGKSPPVTKRFRLKSRMKTLGENLEDVVFYRRFGQSTKHRPVEMVATPKEGAR